MHYLLAPHIRLALIGDDAVWLDLRDDSYQCTPGAALVRTADGRLEMSDGELARNLLAAGLLTADASGVPMGALPPPPGADLAPRGERAAAHPISLRWWSRGLWRHYRHGCWAPLHRLSIIAGAVRPRHVGPERPLADAAREILAVQIWQPAPGACLQRSFQMVCMLREAGFACRWVFGVRTWPFAAHCWVEAGGVALNDLAGRIADFQPIFDA